ncbi:MAG: hypothetical protein ACI92E_001193 [Oceanicoccus sp.]
MQKDLLRPIRLTFLGLLTRRKSQIIYQNKTIVMIGALCIGASQVNITGVHAVTRKKFWNVDTKIGEDGKLATQGLYSRAFTYWERIVL